MRKPLWLLSGAAMVWSGSALGPASAAFAEQDRFCGFLLQPGHTCNNATLGDWDRARTRYPGHESHGVFAGVYMYNTRTKDIRGDAIWAGRTWSNPTWNPYGHNYGVTHENDYIVYNKLYGEYAHTLVGWTSDNQVEAASADYK